MTLADFNELKAGIGRALATNADFVHEGVYFVLRKTLPKDRYQGMVAFMGTEQIALIPYDHRLPVLVRVPRLAELPMLLVEALMSQVFTYDYRVATHEGCLKLTHLADHRLDRNHVLYPCRWTIIERNITP